MGEARKRRKGETWVVGAKATYAAISRSEADKDNSLVGRAAILPPSLLYRKEPPSEAPWQRRFISVRCSCSTWNRVPVIRRTGLRGLPQTLLVASWDTLNELFHFPKSGK